jgi:arylsulfatase A-like enzyme/Ca2+-binding RTX toxin-like protein
MTTPPNILFIAIDDLFDFNAFRDSFGVRIHTPNMDRLFADSTVFENAFATTPVCNPSRTSTLTGKSPFETNVHDNVVPWYETTPLGDSLPALMKDGGYHTAQAGKVFHGYKPQPEFVNDRLFSEDVPNIVDTFDRALANPNGGGWQAQGYVGEDAEFYDHKVASHGINFLNSYSGTDPFMLMLGFKHPHNTFELPQEYYDLYDLDQIKVPDAWVNGDLSDAPAFAAQFMVKGQFFPDKDFDEWAATVEGYLAAISHADAQVGRVLDALEASGHTNDTAVLLYSDHGFQLGDKDHFGKFTLWEESAKAPLSLKVPGIAGQVVTTPVSLIDIMPTLLELGGQPAADHAVGDSLLSFLGIGAEPYEEGPVFTQVYGSMSIRTGDFRFIRYADGSEELYDTRVDPSQTINLAAHPARTAQLESLRDELWDEAARYGVTTNDDDEIIYGTAGRDVLMAQPETQALVGGGGDDIYFLFGNSAQVIEQATGGYDIAYLSGDGRIDLPANVEEGFYGTVANAGTVTIYGNGLDNLIRVIGAPVSIHAGGGNDTVIAEEWSGNRIWGDAGDDHITGANWSDRLYGGAGDDTLLGGRGTDFLTGGLGADLLDGGDGFDTADYTDSTTGVHVSLFTGRGYGDRAWGDRLVNIERLWGSDYNDVLMGDHGVNTLIGNDGDDYLHGYDGDDQLFGGMGADELVGGGGRDLVSYQFSGQGVVANLGLGRGWQGEAQGDTYYWVEDVTGSNRDDTLIGTREDNTLDGRNGNDYLHGGDGDDTLIGGRGADGLVGGRGQDVADYSGSTAGVAVNLLDGTASGGDAEGDWFWSVEDVTGSKYADTLTGGNVIGTINGGQGADALRFGYGNTTATGGGGADRFVADAQYLTEGASHTVTDFEAGRDAMLLRGATALDRLEVTAGGDTRLTLTTTDADGDSFLSLITLKGVTLSETDVVHVDDDDADPDLDPF